MNKVLLFGVFVVLALCSFSSQAKALDSSVLQEVKVNSEVVDETETFTLALERGNEIDVKVKLLSNTSIGDVQVEAVMRGYDHNDLIEDITSLFDLSGNVTVYKELTLTLPNRLDRDTYNLRIYVSDRDSDTVVKDYNIEITTTRHSLELDDVIFSPSGQVTAGRVLLVTARIENNGEKDQDGIKVTTAIPALGISESAYIDEIQSGDEESSEELYLRIPSTATPGNYNVVVSVEYDDGDEYLSESYSVEVTADEAMTATADEPASIVAPSTQNLMQGQGGASYPLLITNNGATAKTYTFSVSGVDFGGYTVSPSTAVVVESGNTKTVTIYLTADLSATAGEHAFIVTATAGSESNQVPLTVNVVESTDAGWGSVKRGLEVGLVILVILLIVLGLVIGVNKLKGSEEEDSESGQTYY